jgi:probable HAF family extracellular repeat protein
MFTSDSHRKAREIWWARWLPRGVAGLACPLALASAAGAATSPRAAGPAAVSPAIAGRAGTASPELRVINLGTLGGLNSEATAINDHGAVIGYAETRQLDGSCIYYQGRMHNLGTWTATAINDNRVVAGYADTGTPLAFAPVLLPGGDRRCLLRMLG